MSDLDDGDPDAFASLAPLAGSTSGLTFLGEAGGVRTVVRLYVAPTGHGPLAHEVDAALLSLVRGLLPVPRVLEVRGPVGDLPAVLVTEHLPGEPAEAVLPGLDDAGRQRLGRGLGRLAGALAGMPTTRHGRFVDPSLVPQPWPDPWLEPWPEEAVGEEDGAARAEAVLDVEPRASLVHGDLHPGHVLVDPATLEVTGLVGWGRAHAGHPWTDLGRLLRSEHGAEEAPYAAGVRAGWAELRGTERARDLVLARSADARSRAAH